MNKPSGSSKQAWDDEAYFVGGVDNDNDEGNNGDDDEESMFQRRKDVDAEEESLWNPQSFDYGPPAPKQTRVVDYGHRKGAATVLDPGFEAPPRGPMPFGGGGGGFRGQLSGSGPHFGQSQSGGGGGFGQGQRNPWQNQEFNQRGGGSFGQSSGGQVNPWKKQESRAPVAKTPTPPTPKPTSPKQPPGEVVTLDDLIEPPGRYIR